jgi:hypothetical protein
VDEVPGLECNRGLHRQHWHGQVGALHGNQRKTGQVKSLSRG